MNSCYRIFLHLIVTVYILSIPIITFAEPIALYRLFNHRNDHLYTTNCQESLDARNNEYGIEGIAGYVESTQIEGTVPLYRLWKPSDHFYTANPNERNALLAAGYTDEGIVGYIRPAGTPDTTAFYRSFNVTSGDHFYTTSKREHDNAIRKHGYKDEGFAGYIWSTGKQCSSIPPPPPPPPSSGGCQWVSDGEHPPFLECT